MGPRVVVRIQGSVVCMYIHIYKAASAQLHAGEWLVIVRVRLQALLFLGDSAWESERTH